MHIAITARTFDVQSNAREITGRDFLSVSELNGNNLRQYVAVAFIRYHKNVATNNGIKIERPNHRNKISATNKIIPFVKTSYAAVTCIKRVFLHLCCCNIADFYCCYVHI